MTQAEFAAGPEQELRLRGLAFSRATQAWLPAPLFGGNRFGRRLLARRAAGTSQ
jgi:hypothetical protein